MSKKITIEELVNKLEFSEGSKIGNAMSLFSKTIDKFKTVIDFSMGRLEDAVNKIEIDKMFNNVFKNDRKDMLQWINDFSDKLVLDSSEVKNSVTLLTLLGRSMGLVESDAKTLGKNMSALAYDISSFYNIDVESSFGKISSALSGTSGPLRELGINVSETTVNATALKYGIAGIGEEMSENQKVMARYMAILDQTQDAQGNLARTLSSPANMMRALTSTAKELSAAFGSFFIPALQAILPWVLTLTKALTKLFNTLLGSFGLLNSGTQKTIDLSEPDNEIDSSNDSGNFVLPDYDWGFGEIEADVERLTEKLMNFINQINFTPLMKAFEDLKSLTMPIIGTIGAGLEYLFVNIMVPLGKWTISHALPAFINLLSGGLRAADPVIRSVSAVGKVLFDVFLIPLTKFTGLLFISAIDSIAFTLRGLGMILSDNQPLVIAGTALIGAFIASFKVAELVHFISTSGGIVNALLSTTQASKLLLAVRNSELIVQIELGAMMLEEQAIRLVSVAKMALETAAQNGSTTAKIIYTVATELATLATMAFTLAVQLLSNPLGLVVLALGAVVTWAAIYKSGAEDAGKATSLLSQAQIDLQRHFAGTEERLRNTETEFDRLADETLPKLKDQYEDVTRTLAKERLGINTEGLEGLGEKTQAIFETARTAIDTNTNLIYEGLAQFYSNSNTLTEDQEQEILDKVLLSGQKQQEQVQAHHDAMIAIQKTASAQGRDLTTQERADYEWHLGEMNRIAIETITPEQARQTAQLEAFNARKGDLHGEERDEYLKLLKEEYDSALSTIQTSYGYQLDAIEKAKAKGILTEEEYNSQKTELINAMNSEEYKLADEQIRKMLEMATGMNAEQLNEYKDYITRYNELQNRKLEQGDIVLTEEERQFERLYLAKKDSINNAMAAQRDFNENWLKQQPDIFKGIYENISKGMTLEEGIKQIESQRSKAYEAALYTTEGITKGVNDGRSNAVNAIGDMAASMISRAKKILDINSPSRAMQKLFGYVGEGAALGINENVGKVIEAMSDMVDGALSESSRLTSFQYPDFSQNFNTSTTPLLANLEAAVKFTVDNLVSGYEKLIEATNNQEIMIENHTTVDVDGEKIGKTLELISARRKFRTGGAY